MIRKQANNQDCADVRRNYDDSNDVDEVVSEVGVVQLFIDDDVNK